MDQTAKDAGAVLVIDDDPDTRELLRAWLTTRGHEAFTAWDGLDGLEQLDLKRRVIKAVILDLEMPTMSGDGFREQQTFYPQLREVPVIVSSGHPQGEEVAAEMGAFAFIAKPVDLHRLGDALDRALGCEREYDSAFSRAASSAART